MAVEKKPCWLVWAHHRDGSVQLRGVATAEVSLRYMRGAVQGEAELYPNHPNPVVRVTVEHRDPGLDHLYGGSGL